MSSQGTAGAEAAGIGRASRGPQTVEEAREAEEARREGMSESELEEAKARDAQVRVAEEHAPEDAVPAVGSPDEEGREDLNAEDTVLDEGVRFGTDEDGHVAKVGD